MGLLPGVAVVADSWWTAQQARAKLDIKWADHPTAQQSTTAFKLAAGQCAVRAPMRTERNDGDCASALVSAAKMVQATYFVPYLHHAPMEPQNCTAHFKDGKVEIWSGSQGPSGGRTAVAALLGVPQSAVTVHMVRAGGGFGRRGVNDSMVEAAWISKVAGAPVKLIWSREDDTRHGFYRAMAQHILKAGIDANGEVTAWHNHFATTGTGDRAGRAAAMSAQEFPARYVPNFRQDVTILESGVPSGYLRAPVANGVAFVMQSFIDELAHAAGKDPVAFRLKMLEGKAPTPGYDASRAAAVLKLAAEKSGWGRKMPARHGLGIAFHYAHQGYFAEVVEVRVDADGTVKPLKVWAACDVGRQIINPSGAEGQVEGSIYEGLSHALHQKITIDKGAVVQSNFGDYPIMRINEACPVEIHFILSNNNPTGLGEPALPPVIPALTNAIYAATGKRIRELPIDKAMLKA